MARCVLLHLCHNWYGMLMTLLQNLNQQYIVVTWPTFFIVAGIILKPESNEMHTVCEYLTVPNQIQPYYTDCGTCTVWDSINRHVIQLLKCQ